MIAYTHKVHSRSKSIKIHLEPNGEVVVTTPRFTPKIAIKAMIRKNKTWIEKQLLRIKQQQNLMESATQLQIFGKTHFKEKLQLNSQKEVDRFLKSTATRYILPRTKKIAEEMGINFGRVTLRQQKTRWGSCSSQGNLNFNWRLVHFPTPVVDYVIIHELAHRKQMNHSAHFWDLVRKHDPAYAQHRGWLKRHGLTLG